MKKESCHVCKKELEKYNLGATVTEPGSSIKNKTGGWRSYKPVIDRQKCIKCGKCWMFCPDNAIKIKKEGAEVDYDFCKGCGICAKECPVNAIKMVKEKK